MSGAKTHWYKRKGTIIRPFGARLRWTRRRNILTSSENHYNMQTIAWELKMIKTRQDLFFCNMQSHVQSIEQPDGQCDSVQKYKKRSEKEGWHSCSIQEQELSFYRKEQQYQTLSKVNLMTAQEHCMHFYAIEFVYKSKKITKMSCTMNVIRER